MAATAAVAATAVAASTAGSVISARKNRKAQEKVAKNQVASIEQLARIRNSLAEESLQGTFLNQFGADEIFGTKPEEINLADSVRKSALLNEDILALNRDLVERTNTGISEDAIRRAGILDPNFRQSISALSDAARAQLRGEIPEDVIESINRARAEGAAVGGVGTPGAQRAATARDLGLTSLDLQQRGASLFQQINAARESIDPVSRQISLNQFLLTPEQQIQTDIANRAIRAAPDPTAQQLFKNEFTGAREEAFARGNVTVPVDNTLGAGLSAFGGGLTGLLSSGFFGTPGGGAAGAKATGTT